MREGNGHESGTHIQWQFAIFWFILVSFVRLQNQYHSPGPTKPIDCDEALLRYSHVDLVED